MKKREPDVYTYDGRIDPDKALALIEETMEALTPDEFRRLSSEPFKMGGTPDYVVRAAPQQNKAVKPASSPKSQISLGATADKKSGGSKPSTTTPGRPPTKAVKKTGS